MEIFLIYLSVSWNFVAYLWASGCSFPHITRRILKFSLQTRTMNRMTTGFYYTVTGIRWYAENLNGLVNFS
ncbi:hypothetical protein P8452_00189 [Trifolium repens]|nr:hypothetical protein P8452_00189 [Trifolium repens]